MITAGMLAQRIAAGRRDCLTDQQVAEDILRLITPQEAAAMAHPLRPVILRLVAEMGEASPSAMAEKVGVPLGNVSYHVRKLAKLGLLRETRRVPRRGAVEHYYEVAS